METSKTNKQQMSGTEEKTKGDRDENGNGNGSGNGNENRGSVGSNFDSSVTGSFLVSITVLCSSVVIFDRS